MTSPTKPKATGDCFAAAGKLIRDSAAFGRSNDCLLVHGNLAHLSQDGPVNHAWVEEGAFVHEVSNGQNAVFAKDLYYECNGVTTVRKYTRTEALVLGIRHLHWGPWA